MSWYHFCNSWFHSLQYLRLGGCSELRLNSAWSRKPSKAFCQFCRNLFNCCYILRPADIGFTLQFMTTLPQSLWLWWLLLLVLRALHSVHRQFEWWALRSQKQPGGENGSWRKPMAAKVKRKHQKHVTYRWLCKCIEHHQEVSQMFTIGTQRKMRGSLWHQNGLTVRWKLTPGEAKRIPNQFKANLTWNWYFSNSWSTVRHRLCEYLLTDTSQNQPMPCTP